MSGGALSPTERAEARRLAASLPAGAESLRTSAYMAGRRGWPVASVEAGDHAESLDALAALLPRLLDALEARERACERRCMGFPVRGTATWVREERLTQAEAERDRLRTLLAQAFDYVQGEFTNDDLAEEIATTLAAARLPEGDREGGAA